MFTIEVNGKVEKFDNINDAYDYVIKEANKGNDIVVYRINNKRISATQFCIMHQEANE